MSKIKNVIVILHPKFAEFQIGHTLFLLKKVGNANIITATIDGNPVESIGGLNVHADVSLEQLKIDQANLLLIPGGDGIQEVINEKKLSEILVKTFDSNIPIAASCGATVLVAKAGILKKKKFTCAMKTYEHHRSLFEHATYTGTNVQIDDSIITAKATACAELAIKIGDLLNMFKDDNQREKLNSFLKE